MAALRQLDDRVTHLESQAARLHRLGDEVDALRRDVHGVRDELRQFHHLGWALLVGVLIAPALAHWVQVVLGI